jgi:hypothetical protein
MSKERAIANGGSWAKKVKGWTIHHFAMADKEANLPSLLRRVAGSIDELGEIEVFGITYQVEVRHPSNWATVTVYFDFRRTERADNRTTSKPARSGRISTTAISRPGK